MPIEKKSLPDPILNYDYVKMKTKDTNIHKERKHVPKLLRRKIMKSYIPMTITMLLPGKPPLLMK